MNEINYARQFTTSKAGFLKGNVLQDWEKAALGSYAAVMNIRQNLGVFFTLLALNAGFRLFMMGNVSDNMQSAMMIDLGGFVIVGILATVTFFVPKWWMVLVTAIAIFPFALGIITGLMAIAFLCTLPTLKRANESLYISSSQYTEMKPVFAEIGAGKFPDTWPEVGKLGKIAFRARFFNNAAVFLSGKNLLNTLAIGDSQQCVIEKDKKGRNVLKKWVLNGKLKNTNILLTDQGHSSLRHWMAGDKSEASVSYSIAQSPATQTDDASATTTCSGCHATIPDVDVCPKCGRAQY